MGCRESMLLAFGLGFRGMDMNVGFNPPATFVIVANCPKAVTERVLENSIILLGH